MTLWCTRSAFWGGLLLAGSVVCGTAWSATTLLEEKLVAPPQSSTPEAPSSLAPPHEGSVVVVPDGSSGQSGPGTVIILPRDPGSVPDGPATPPVAVPQPNVLLPVLPTMPERPGDPQSTEPRKDVQIVPVLPLKEVPRQDIPKKEEDPAQKPGQDPAPLLTPGQFIPLTPIPSEKGPKPPKAEKTPATPPPPPKDQTPAKEPGKELGKEPGKEEPKTSPKEPKKPKAMQGKAKSGDALRIPPEAVKSGDLSFLEGCWRGTRPEYGTKRIIVERFCFDKQGRGKRHIQDPAVAGECFGSTQGSLDPSGKLTVRSDTGYCSSGARWAAAEMMCQGEGNATPCYWLFKGKGGGSQSYKIPFVKE